MENRIKRSFKGIFVLATTTLMIFLLSSCESQPKKQEVVVEPPPQSNAINEKLTYNYAQLAMKDLDQMNAMVLEQLRVSKAYDTDPEPLKKAVVFIFSRPNEDGTLEKVLSYVKNPLYDQDLWNETLSQLTDKSIESLKNPQGLNGREQVTYSVILLNILSELKPDLKKQGFEMQLVQRIADANIEFSKEARAERSLGQMRGSSSSPSVVAKLLLEPYQLKK